MIVCNQQIKASIFVDLPQTAGLGPSPGLMQPARSIESSRLRYIIAPSRAVVTGPGKVGRRRHSRRDQR
jgi:hypothetical protein